MGLLNVQSEMLTSENPMKMFLVLSFALLLMNEDFLITTIALLRDNVFFKA